MDINKTSNTLITFSCKSLAPLFIGNANKFNAELRPSTIKASLQFWWRAIHPHLSALEMKNAEAHFFGGNFTKNDKQENCLPSFRFVSVEQLAATNKKIHLDPRNGKNKGMAKAILENQSFNIKIQLLTAEQKEKVLAIFYIASMLGGIGKRARRGAGAWEIEYYSVGDNQKEVMYSLENLHGYITKFNSNYKIKNSKIEYNHGYSPKYSFLKKVEIGDHYNNQNQLRIQIMETAHKLHEKRHYREYLGNASPRLSSPIYVSMFKHKDSLKPVVSKLHNKSSRNDREGEKLQQSFTNAILNNTDNDV